VRVAAEEGHSCSHLESGWRAAVTECEATPIAEGSFLSDGEGRLAERESGLRGDKLVRR
jgi:hypothetical protein